MEKLLDTLYPITRSITGQGQLATLKIINEEVPIDILEYPTGQQCYDWSVPQEWNVESAFIKNQKGEIIVDINRNNLHLAGYSIPFIGEMKLDELKKHLHTRPDLPDAIPYITYYYKNDWAFCITHNQYEKLANETYHIEVNTGFKDGYLRIGEYIKKGQSSQEIWLSTYTCHPSMGNDNLSGILAAVELIKHLESLPETHYTYRVLFMPETIGPIVYLFNNKKTIPSILGGYVLTHCGDRSDLTYKLSLEEGHSIDKMMLIALEKSGLAYRTQPFVPLGSDERQYSSPKFKLPFGSLMRSSHTPMDLKNPFIPEWKEYHTSLDNLGFIDISLIKEVTNIYKDCIQNHEYNLKYCANYYGEPWLSKHNLYVSPEDNLEKAKAVFYFQGLANGKYSLWDISEKFDIDIDLLSQVASQFEKCGLVTAL